MVVADMCGVRCLDLEIVAVRINKEEANAERNRGHCSG